MLWMVLVVVTDEDALADGLFLLFDEAGPGAVFFKVTADSFLVLRC